MSRLQPNRPASSTSEKACKKALAPALIAPPLLASAAQISEGAPAAAGRLGYRSGGGVPHVDPAIAVCDHEVAEVAQLDEDPVDALVLDRDPGLARLDGRVQGLDRDALMIEHFDRRPAEGVIRIQYERVVDDSAELFTLNVIDHWGSRWRRPSAPEGGSCCRNRCAKRREFVPETA
jgi:hypothetical protein